MDKRNWKIYFEWLEGKDYKQLSKEFELSINTIKEICVSHLPKKIKGNLYWSQNSYKRFKDWRKSQPDHSGNSN